MAYLGDFLRGVKRETPTSAQPRVVAAFFVPVRIPNRRWWYVLRAPGQGNPCLVSALRGACGAGRERKLPGCSQIPPAREHASRAPRVKREATIYLTHLARRSRLTFVSAKVQQPSSLLEAIRYFSDLDVANDFVAQLRWPDGPFCPRCGCTEYSYVSTRRLWKCKGCKKQYSVKVGTIFEDSPIGLEKWLPAVWLLTVCKNGISSYELHRALGVTQKTAWFMLHRIRKAMQTGSFMKLSGEVEVDETFIGGFQEHARGQAGSKYYRDWWQGQDPGARVPGAGREGDCHGDSEPQAEDPA